MNKIITNKKKLFISMVIMSILCIFYMVSCDDSTKIVKLQEEVEEACMEHDFEKARNTVIKINNFSSKLKNEYEDQITSLETVIELIRPIKVIRRALREKVHSLEDKIQVLDEKKDFLLFVNDKEIYYLLASNSKDNANRVMYLYNTYEKEQLPDMVKVLKVAITQGNDYLAEKLIKGGVEPNLDVIKAAVSTENEELLDMIVQKRPELLEDNEVVEVLEE